MTLPNFLSDFVPSHFALESLRYFEVVIRRVRKGFKVSHPRQQHPHQLLVLTNNRDVDRSHAVVFDSPHIVAIIDNGFLNVAVGLGDLIGGKFEGVGSKGMNESEAENEAYDEDVEHVGYPT